MNLLFWKKKKPATDEGAEVTKDDKTALIATGSEEENTDKPGMLARLRTSLAGLGQRFKKRQTPEEKEGGTVPDSAREEQSAPNAIAAVRSKKRLILGGIAGVTFLLLTGIGFAVWKFALAPAKPDEHPSSATAPHARELASGAANHAEKPSAEATLPAADTHTELEALKKKNEELQAQVEALKKGNGQEQKAAISPAETKAERNTATAPSVDKEMIFSGKDPKASAQALKQAIEEMNAASGGRKPRKPAE